MTYVDTKTHVVIMAAVEAAVAAVEAAVNAHSYPVFYARELVDTVTRYVSTAVAQVDTRCSLTYVNQRCERPTHSHESYCLLVDGARYPTYMSDQRSQLTPTIGS